MQPLRQEVPLTELETGRSGTIARLAGGAGVQDRLRALGVAEGLRISKVSRIGKAGPVVVVVNRAQIAVGNGMASKIFIRVDE